MSEKLYLVDQFYPGDFALILTGVYTEEIRGHRGSKSATDNSRNRAILSSHNIFRDRRHKYIPRSSKLLSYAGIIASVTQSLDIIQYRRIMRHGSKNLRWIITECVHIHLRFDPSSSISRFYRGISKGCKKKGKAKVANSNKLLKMI